MRNIFQTIAISLVLILDSGRTAHSQTLQETLREQQREQQRQQQERQREEERKQRELRQEQCKSQCERNYDICAQNIPKGGFNYCRGTLTSCRESCVRNN
jgi:hypothetical protein